MPTLYPKMRNPALPDVFRSTPTPPGPWMRAYHATKQYGIARSRLLRLAASGQIRVQSRPGEAMRFNKLDVERIAARPD